MMLENECVGIGFVATTDTNNFCSGTQIGQGNVSIVVEECLKYVDLLLHTMDTRELRRAVWSAIHWPRIFLRPFGDDDRFGALVDNEFQIMGEDDPMQPPIIDTMPITSLETDFKIRES